MQKKDILDQTITNIQQEADAISQERKNWEEAMQKLKEFNETLKRDHGLEISAYMQPVVSLVRATQQSEQTGGDGQVGEDAQVTQPSS